MEVKGLPIILGFTLIGIGRGLIAFQIMNPVLSQVSSQRTGETAALKNTSQNLGMSLGTALMGSILLAGFASGAIALTDESTVLPDPVKDNLTVAVEQNVRFLSNEELESILKETPSDISQEILRINEIPRIEGIKRSLWGMILISWVYLLHPPCRLKSLYLLSKMTKRVKFEKFSLRRVEGKRHLFILHLFHQSKLLKQ